MNSEFPLAKQTIIDGNRRLVREKILQILYSKYISDFDNTQELFEYVFFREFNFGDDEQKYEKLLRPDEIIEIEGDYPIKWDEDQIKFGETLFTTISSNYIKFDEMVTKFSSNWDLDRIALIDRILIHIALAEFLFFDYIPTKVTMNEVLEISKLYSTDKSSLFINGLLESLKNSLELDNKIVKTGRGKIEK